ncbi:hypothetical protein B0T24DRAFT_117901 [Lasiosphaeria ovina]|uniref:Uncharacterized protein n=1 Tax=Lasiosphaeria ovina TaxID=92902 RepID=A0AAE0MYL8_9PEZI|nr:hypothetical protein B0T24DRAFT_117901 [Lasiosphaeria ovina]
MAAPRGQLRGGREGRKAKQLGPKTDDEDSSDDLPDPPQITELPESPTLTQWARISQAKATQKATQKSTAHKANPAAIATITATATATATNPAANHVATNPAANRAANYAANHVANHIANHAANHTSTNITSRIASCNTSLAADNTASYIASYIAKRFEKNPLEAKSPYEEDTKIEDIIPKDLWRDMAKIWPNLLFDQLMEWNHEGKEDIYPYDTIKVLFNYMKHIMLRIPSHTGQPARAGGTGAGPARPINVYSVGRARLAPGTQLPDHIILPGTGQRQ